MASVRNSLRCLLLFILIMGFHFIIHLLQLGRSAKLDKLVFKQKIVYDVDIRNQVMTSTRKSISQPLDIRAGKQRKSIQLHLDQHKRDCLKFWDTKALASEVKPVCDCIPDTLLGEVSPILVNASMNDLILENPEVSRGGHWEPRTCMARYQVKIVIPFRDRHSHLSVLLRYLHPMLQGQQLDYTIIVVEQNSPAVFNKAALMNVGYKYATQRHKPDCIIFHDVDFIPEDGRNFYTCREMPLHLGAFHDRHNYTIKYGFIFGGVTAFRPAHFEKVNGFSNRYFGWGGEDDDMRYRIREKGLHILRSSKEVARYKVITHNRDKGNLQPNKSAMLYHLFHDRRLNNDGLNSLKFTIKKLQMESLYTWLLVHIQP